MDDPTLRYWLPHHVYVCRVRDTVVFLDLASDRYQSIHGEQMRALGAVVHGWPADTAPGAAARGSNLAEQLRAKGLLTLEASRGKPATPADLGLSDVPVAVGTDRMHARPIRFRDIVNFLFAWIRVIWRQRRGTLHAMVTTLQLRKQHRSSIACDEEKLVELVCVFRRLRCYAFTAREHCLFNALVLMEFLARYDVHPTFVMGVRLMPWGAHSWVQHGPMVLNATPSSIRDFTPILTA
jgi:transglutaminase superfamily protein